MIAVRLLSVGLILLCVSCSRGPAAVEHANCDSLDYAPLLQRIDSFEVYAGNREGRAPRPLISTAEPGKIAAITNYLGDRLDRWYVAAGETYDPKSRHAVAEFTVELMSGGRSAGYLGVGSFYLETPGCAHEVSRPMTPEDRAALLNILFDAPLPKFLGNQAVTASPWR